MSDLNVMTYRRQPDGKYLWEGRLEAAAPGYQLMQAETGRAFGDFTLARAIEILEKGPLRQEWYKVIPIPEKEVSGAAAAAKQRKADKIASGEIAPKAPRVPREKKAPVGYQAKPLTDEEVIRVNAIQTEKNIDRAAACKMLRTEQRVARLATARATKGPSKNSTLDDEKIRTQFTNGMNANQIAKSYGCAYMSIRTRLLKMGLIQPPVKSTTQESEV
jgi:hypothetical protein